MQRHENSMQDELEKYKASDININNDFYNDEIYNYKEYFGGGNNSGGGEMDYEDDENDMMGPLAIGAKHSYIEDDTCEDGDGMMMDNFFKRVDSLELVKPKKAKIVANHLFGELLGDGSYGKVKECLDLDSLSRRAVKIINLKTVARKIPRGVINVRKEINIMKRLNHKNVIKLYDVFEKNVAKKNDEAKDDNDDFGGGNIAMIEKPPKIYIFMDYCMTNLEALLKNAPLKRLCNWQLNFYFKQLIDGLEYLHSIGVIHNDIKPSNLLVTCDETLKICDFSVSADLKLFLDYDYNANDSDYYDILNDNMSPNAFPLSQCTPMFQCPEMLAENLDKRSLIDNASKIDVWASGVTLYQLSTGALPFHGQTVHQIFENIRSASYEIEIPVFVDKNLEKLLRGMINRNPVERLSLKQIRDLEWFKKKHPCVRDEVAQWPAEVLQNETGTFRMLQYLEKLCDNQEDEDAVAERARTQLEEKIRSTNGQEMVFSGANDAASGSCSNNNFNFNEDEMTDEYSNKVISRNTPNTNPSVVSMNSNAANSALNANSSVRQNASSNTMSNSSANRTYSQATKMKKSNCLIS